jgi:protein-tyrosine phosphatase
MSRARVGVLFVCLGNICRSPLARAVFAQQALERGVLDRLDIDSCGTGHWHVGGPADERSIAVARRHNVPLAHVARQVEAPADFARFRYLIAMDASNRRNLLHLGAESSRVTLFRQYDVGDERSATGDGAPAPDVPDPYTLGPDAFEEVFALVTRCSRGLLDHLERNDLRD